MAASQSAMAFPKLQAPVRRFEQHAAAVQAMAGYEAALRENALRRRSNGFGVTDQDQPVEAFCLVPTRPLMQPLALIGGMGPLAGARAFRRACARFHDSRTLVLYQACSMPDRSTIILSEDGSDPEARARLSREMAWQLAGAVRFAASLAGPASQPPRCIVACNSAHYFWRLLEDRLRQTSPEAACHVQLVSLVDATLQALQSQPCRRTLVLAAEGARVGQVFSAPLRNARIAFEEPPAPLGRLLMRAIFEGVKSLDDLRAVELGNQFFEAILQTGQDYDCILAGCTELPLTFDLLRLHGSPSVAAFLSRVRIVDPLEEALYRA
jgi:aspartate/glutamate racemase